MRLKPILLPTAREPFKMPYDKHIPKSDLVLGLVDSPMYSKGLGLTKDRGAIGNFSKEMYQNIYLIDEKEEIKEGDWIVDTYIKSNEIKKVKSFNNALYQFEKGVSRLRPTLNKIIASTDSSLGLPLLSEQSIKLLIDYYNKNGKMVESVEIDVNTEPVTDGDWEKYYDIKLNDQGTVNISIPEEKMYSREEVEKLCRNAMFTGELLGRNPEVKTPLGKGFDEISKNWVKKNL